jgi:predicted esterase
MGKIKPWKTNWMIILLVLVFPSCKVMLPPGIAKQTWYISDTENIAVKFDSPRKGEYININRAVATPQPFRVRQRRNITSLKLSGRPDISGKISVFHDKLHIASKDATVEFRQYYTRVFPRSPFRYTDEVFEEITSSEVEYGNAPGFYSSKTIEKRDNKSYNQVLFDVAEGVTGNLFRGKIPLEMDIYQPQGDQIKNRPCLVLLHAGAFIAGDKRDELVSKLATDYAKRGYVVASVNYRLGYVFLPGRYSNLERAMYNAVQDVRASLRYLSYNHKELGIDPDMFFLGGHSAGGILSLTTAFMDETEVWPSARGSLIRIQSDLGCLDCSTNELYGPFKIKGVINMWGALDNLNIIKPHNQIPILSIHGDEDRVVPYGYDFPFTNVSSRASAFFSRRIHGSSSILNHTNTLGIDHTLYTFVGWGHEPHFDENHKLIDENYSIIDTQMLSFLNKGVFKPLDRITGPFSISRNDRVPEYRVVPNNYDEYFFRCDGCLIISESPFSARIVWLDGTEQLQLHVAGKGPNAQIATDIIQIHVIP